MPEGLDESGEVPAGVSELPELSCIVPDEWPAAPLPPAGDAPEVSEPVAEGVSDDGERGCGCAASGGVRESGARSGGGRNCASAVCEASPNASNKRVVV